jgi:hypothetical protein
MGLRAGCTQKKIAREEIMTLLAAVLILFKVVFWLFLIAVEGLFLFALIFEMIETFRAHNRRAARVATQVPPAPSISEGWVGTRLVRRLRHSLHF